MTMRSMLPADCCSSLSMACAGLCVLLQDCEGQGSAGRECHHQQQRCSCARHARHTGQHLAAAPLSWKLAEEFQTDILPMALSALSELGTGACRPTKHRPTAITMQSWIWSQSTAAAGCCCLAAGMVSSRPGNECYVSTFILRSPGLHNVKEVVATCRRDASLLPAFSF